MTPVTSTDGNVIHADFGKQEPLFSVSCKLLYADEHFVAMRITYRLFGRDFIQHVVKGVGIDA